MDRFESLPVPWGEWGFECARSGRGFVVVHPAWDDWVSFPDIESLAYFMDGLRWGRPPMSEEG